MPEHAHRREGHRHAAHGPFGYEEDHRLGEEAMHFTRWFAQSKYHLMGGFLGELRRDPAERDPAELQERYCRALTHAQRMHQVRGAVTFLLALGVVAAAAATIADLFQVDAQTDLLERAAALTTSASVALVAIRLLLDRYLERVDVTATFLAMQIATTTGARRASAP